MFLSFGVGSYLVSRVSQALRDIESTVISLRKRVAYETIIPPFISTKPADEWQKSTRRNDRTIVVLVGAIIAFWLLGALYGFVGVPRGGGALIFGIICVCVGGYFVMELTKRLRSLSWWLDELYEEIYSPNRN